MQIENGSNLEDINLNWVLRLPEILKYTEQKNQILNVFLSKASKLLHIRRYKPIYCLRLFDRLCSTEFDCNCSLLSEVNVVLFTFLHLNVPVIYFLFTLHH